MSLILWSCVSGLSQTGCTLADAGFMCEKEVTQTYLPEPRLLIPVWYELCHQRSDTGSEETFVCFLFPVCDVTRKSRLQLMSGSNCLLCKPERGAFVVECVCVCVSVCVFSPDKDARRSCWLLCFVFLLASRSPFSSFVSAALPGVLLG